jgi:cysteine synthase B
MLIKSITEAIGKTPLLEIDPRLHGLKNINLYCKLEHLNPFGSLKDRPALELLKEGLAEIAAKQQTAIESSSGNMAKAMTLICSMHGIPFRIVTNRIAVREVKQILQLVGAQIDEFPGLSSCPDPSDPNNPLAYIERAMTAEPGKYFHGSQYTNEKNPHAHYQSTGPEILQDAGTVDFFVTGLGTTGSSGGIGKFLKEKNANLKMVGVVSPKGQVIPGIRSADEMYEVGLFKKDLYDTVVEVSAEEAIDAMLVLIRKLGVLGGPSSGASFAAALKHLKTIDASLTEKKNAVFIICDRAEWYLSFLQKYRPQLFGLAARKESARTVSEKDANAAPQLSLDEAAKWMETPSGLLVVDMRGSIGFKASHIPGSINMPQEMLEEMSEWGVPFSKGQRVIFVCPTGDQSKRFAAFFKARGVECASLSGGFTAWRDSGKPTERPGAAATQGEKGKG